MITIEAPLKVRRQLWFRRSWVLLAACAAIPFLLRLRLDDAQVRLQAVQDVYRQWRWTGFAQAARGETFLFDRHADKDLFEELFLEELRKDFKIVEFGNFPRVRAFFDGESRLRARVEVYAPSPSVDAPRVWTGESSFVGNGLLLGPWAGGLMVVAGRSVAQATLLGAAITLLWEAGWSPLDAPGRTLNFLRSFAGEMKLRFDRNDWVAHEMGRVPLLAFLVWLLPAVLTWFWIRRTTARKWWTLLAASLVLEPLALGTAELFAKWPDDASWWKVYVGSFVYRFFAGSFLFFFYLRPSWLRDLDEGSDEAEAAERLPWASPLLVAVLLVAGGWAWMNGLLAPGSAEALWRLRMLLVGALLAFITGARVYSLWFAALVFAFQATPTTGHWNASALFGLLMDGLILGWWFSPFKGFRPADGGWGRHVFFLAATSWGVGHLLSSVGVPLGICWIGTLAATWGYAQLLPGADSKKTADVLA